VVGRSLHGGISRENSSAKSLAGFNIYNVRYDRQQKTEMTRDTEALSKERARFEPPVADAAIANWQRSVELVLKDKTLQRNKSDRGFRGLSKKRKLDEKGVDMKDGTEIGRAIESVLGER
jgi:hypothetical protein